MATSLPLLLDRFRRAGQGVDWPVMKLRRNPEFVFSTAIAAVAVGLAMILIRRAGFSWGWAWLVAVNLSVIPFWAWDKFQSRRAGFRVPENALHFGALIGAVPGSLLAMRWLRHKTLKPRFKILYTAFFVLQTVGYALWVRPDWRPF